MTVLMLSGAVLLKQAHLALHFNTSYVITFSVEW